MNSAFLVWFIALAPTLCAPCGAGFNHPVGRPGVADSTPFVPCGPIFFRFNVSKDTNDHRACYEDVFLRSMQDARIEIVIDAHRQRSEKAGVQLKRSEQVKDYLVDEKGIDADRITIRDFSDSCPYDKKDPTLDRRIEIWMMPAGSTVKDIPKRCAN